MRVFTYSVQFTNRFCADLADELVYEDILVLSNPVSPVEALPLHSRIPGGVQ